MARAIKVSVFAIGAVIVFILGAVAATLLWDATHHRYDSPVTGAYYGVVNSKFLDGENLTFGFRFEGRTHPQWRWYYPTNFRYSELDLEWWSEASEGTARLSFPSMQYVASNSTGILTRSLLAQWLLGDTNDPALKADVSRVHAVFDYLEAAGAGTLPVPRHHIHSRDKGVRATIAHFCVGYGVPSFVYVWAGLWLIYLPLVARKIFKPGQRAV